MALRARRMLPDPIMKEWNNPVSVGDEEERSYRQWVHKKRRRALRNVWRVLESNTTAMAKRARQQRRRRQPRREQGGEPNPVAEFRRQMMPLMAQLAELAGADPASLDRRIEARPGRAKRK